MGKNQGSRNRGFSLVEVMIAMVIFSALAISITGVTLSAYSGSEAAIHESVCNSVAAGYMEQLISAEYGDLVDSLEDNSIALPTQINQGVADPIYIGQWNEKMVRDDLVAGRTIRLSVQPELQDISIGGNDMLAVRLRYRWTDPVTGREHERTIRTIRSSLPMSPSPLD